MSGDWIKIGAAGETPIPAYRAAPRDARRGGVVVIQEIFGVNANIRGVCEQFAEHGYEAIAPAMFDRAEPGFEIADIDAAAIAKGRSLAETAPLDTALLDAQAAIDYLAPFGPVFLTGFCYGGSISWLAAQRCKGLAAVSSFYGRMAPDHLDVAPRVPTILHFGREDPSIPLDRVEALRTAFPDAPVHIYPAGHGFMRPGHGYHEDSAKLAWLRTLQLFQKNSGAAAEA